MLYFCTTLYWISAIQRAKSLKDSMPHKDVAHYFKLILNSEHKAADNSLSSDNCQADKFVIFTGESTLWSGLTKMM